MSFIVGQEAKVLIEYTLFKCVVKSIGRKRIKVTFQIPGCNPGEKFVYPEKLASLDENVVLVWEQWKGVNGRGAYRIERVLYPEYHRPAGTIYRQQVYEKSYGVLLECYMNTLESYNSSFR